MKRFPPLLAALLAVLPLAAQRPLYLVNGEPADDIASIPARDIERIEELPADEQTIARYGERASDGVLLITLRYDTPARFGADTTLGAYIARRVRWDDDEPAARVAVRYRITEEGALEVERTIESTDSRLCRRVLKALAEAPRWLPAMKNGHPIESRGVVSIQLPEGKPMPPPVELVIR